MKNNYKYSYLKKFINLSGCIDLSRQNSFYSISESEVVQFENALKFKLPDQLRDFYLEIGYGNLTTPENVPEGYRFNAENEVLRPKDILSILVNGHESGLVSHDVLDMMKPGDLPFFHIADSCLFLIIKPLSNLPNAVYTSWGHLVEENFSDFIWKLYHISPRYFDDK